MFVRTATRRNKDGSAVRYVQLVHNEWDPVTKSSRMRVVHSFGREDQLDRAAIERLAGSLGWTSRQCPDAPQTARPRPCSPISPAGSPLQQRRPCSQGVVSCRFDGCDLARGSARAVTI